jgi:5-methylcytosine-specific restriction enzyme subunit McrC
MPNADAYQMLAYCVALGLPRGLLVYAKDSGAETRLHTIRRHDYRIDVRAVDVELPPDRLLAQVRGIAETMAAPAGVAA